MARTAPVPNIPAIPGMNPGLFVKGGGGGSGGSGGKGGKGGGGKKGANGKNGGKDAAGNNKGAGKCGKGTGSACNSCSTKTKAGDPVDVATGRVSTVGRIDVDLPGPLPLQLERSYSSHAVHRDVGLGWGWTHSYAWELVVRRRRIEVWDDEGTMLEWPALKQGAAHTSHGRTVRREPGGYVLTMDGHRFVFGAIFGNVHRLTAVEDSNGNTIRLDYRTDGRLTGLVDSVGRTVRVRHAADGRIAAFEVQNAKVLGRWFACGEYLYDDRGDLTTFRDAEGFTWRFAYLAETHLLAAYTDPEGLTFHYAYDPGGRCTETWGVHADGTVHGLSPRAPANLADGTPAKGFMHTKIVFVDESLREVVDSREVRRFEVDDAGNTTKSVFKGHVVTRRYDANGFLLEHVDALGAVTTWVRDAGGNAVTETDPLGNVIHYARDPSGRLLRADDAIGRIVEIEYDGRGNRVRLVQGNGETTTFEVDARGLVVRMTEPNGGTWRYRYDIDGNRIEIVEPNGDLWRMEYDALGRPIVQTDPLGNVTRLTWDASNRPASRTMPSGDVKRFRHDGRGNLVHLVDGEGRFVEATFLMNRVVTIRFANGATRTWSYDREGFAAELVDERGQRYESDTDGEGLVREIRSFDGRVRRFEHDARGRLIRHEDAKGQVTEWTRDLRGQVVAVAYPDGTSAEFEHDARGRMTRASNGAASTSYVLDAGDQLLRETMTVGDDTYGVEHAYDTLRRRVALRTSLGHEHAVARDAKGRAIGSTLDRADAVRFHYDPLDREVARELPGGAVVRSTYDQDRWSPSRRSVVPAGAAAAGPRPGEPPWIGPLAASTSLDLGWRYSPNGQRIVETWSSTRGARELEYDVRDQLTAVSSRGARVEEYRYDATGNLFDAAGTRVYARGNRLERKDATEYEWDPDGFLVRKTERRPDGTDRVWTYSWDGAGHLASVITPDDLRVSFAYDPFARRVEKKVERRTVDGPVLISRSRFVWEKSRIVHEIRERAAASGDPVVSERTFYYDEALGHPLAEREDLRSAGGIQPGPWRYHVNDPIGTPDHLVADDGALLATADRDAWGRTAGGGASPLRFDGQWADEETGLHYNRYRYYDPESGRYISQDPAAGLPDPNLYRYTVNPVTWTDFYGLAHTAEAWFTPPKPPEASPTAMNGGESYNSKYDDYTREYNKQNGVDGKPMHPMTNFAKKGPDGTLAHRTSDTEAKILRDLQKKEDAGQNLKGSHCDINGRLPPCSACDRKMNAFAKEKGMTIKYKPDGLPAVTYPK